MDRRNFLRMAGVGIGAAALLPHKAWSTETLAMKSDAGIGKKKMLIAHRGASSYAPENTIPAYELAIKQGADLVEQDLQITKDNVLVCMHDVGMEATTNVEDVFPDRFIEKTVSGKTVKTWPIYQFTLAEIKQLKAGSRTDGQFPATTVPTWQEAIDAIRGKAGLCPETKGSNFYGKLGFDMEKNIAELLRKNGLDKSGASPETPILMQCFDKEGLLRLRTYGIDLPTLWLRFYGSKDLLQAVKEAAAQKFTAIGPAKEDLTEEIVKAAHAANVEVIAYTFEPRSISKGQSSLSADMSHYLYDLGIDGLFTNNPDMFPRKKL